MSSYTINDKGQHDLAPDSRVMLVGNKRHIMRRIRSKYATSGLSIEHQRELMRSRSGRKRLTDLVYKSTKQHYIEQGRSVSYAVARARHARATMHQIYKIEGRCLIIRDGYKGYRGPATDDRPDRSSIYESVTSMVSPDIGQMDRAYDGYRRRISITTVHICHHAPTAVQRAAVLRLVGARKNVNIKSILADISTLNRCAMVAQD